MKSSCASCIPTIIVLTFVLAARTFAQAQTPPSPSSTTEQARPDYKQLRYDEDWSLLRDKSQRTDYLDPIKYMPLGHREDWYLTLGGEARPYYEWFRHEDWGDAPEDRSGFLLQRYMFHADFHMGKRVRFFGQLKSGIESG